MSDLVAAGVAAAGVMGHDFGCRSAAGLACDCDTSRVVSAVAAALGVEVLAEGHVRLVLDLPEADNDRLLKDLNRINESEAAMMRQRGHQWSPVAWRVALWDGAKAAKSNLVATRRVSHAPLEAFALRPLAHAISTSEAAKALGVSIQEVRRICRTGKLGAQQAVGGRRSWSVDAEAVDAIATARRLSRLSVPLGSRPCGGELT